MSQTDLMQIQSFIQTYVEAIAAIVEAEVTVIDRDLVRVGGSGDYAGQTGLHIAHSTLFQRILETGKPGLVRDVRSEYTCITCPLHDQCRELANLAYPIFLRNEVAGVIGLVAVDEQQRERLIQNAEKLENFLHCMSLLIESKLVSEQHNTSLKQQLHEVINEEKRLLNATPFVGNSAVMRDLVALVGKVCRSLSTICISGESGTGKEVLARMIHLGSERAERLMISVNCGAIPENLVESELFGYAEGAFTGARKRGYMGKFELASGSTLFLDEVGEMPLPAQTKLLRVLQEGAVERLGSGSVTPIDVRVICATNRDLRQRVAEGLFREDLYYRLSVIPITVPPLRARKEDIPLLIRHFIEQYNRQLKKSIRGMEPEAERLLLAYEWPGNVRELKNLIEYLGNIIDGNIIRASDLPGHFVARTAPEVSGRPLAELMTEYEKNILTAMLRRAGTLAEKERLALSLGISRATLYRKLAAYNLL